MDAHNVTAPLWHIMIRQMKIESYIFQDSPQRGSDDTVWTDSTFLTSLSNLFMSCFTFHLWSRTKSLHPFINLYITAIILAQTMWEIIFLMYMGKFWMPVIPKSRKYLNVWTLLLFFHLTFTHVSCLCHYISL